MLRLWFEHGPVENQADMYECHVEGSLPKVFLKIAWKFVKICKNLWNVAENLMEKNRKGFTSSICFQMFKVNN